MTIVGANEFVQSCNADDTPQSVVENAFSALGCAQKEVRYLAVAGTAGKTCVAQLTASILRAAALENVGVYLGGSASLRNRILIGEKVVPAKIYVSAVAMVQKLMMQPGFFEQFADDFAFVEKQKAEASTEVQEVDEVAAEFGFKPMQPILSKQVDSTLSVAAVEFLVACICFTKAGCSFAVLELQEPAYAQILPTVSACAITQLGIDAKGNTARQAAKAACGLLRSGVAVVTSPAQPVDALTEIVAAAGAADAMLTVPELDDFGETKHYHLQNRMDYGGYQVMLPYLGVHAAHNAAIAIELALAVWRTGVDISDDAILEGLSAAENEASLFAVQYTPMLTVDACHLPMQAAALAQWVKAEDYQALSLVVGFDEDNQLDAFFAALETGVVVDNDNPEKEQLPGMSDHAFDKVYAVKPDCANAVPTATVMSYGKFHFEMIACSSLAQALAQAQADANDGVVVCGCEALAQAAKKQMS